MTEKQLDAYSRLLKTDRKLTLINRISAVLEYDFETVMSKLGGDERGRQMSWLSTLTHELSTGGEVGECLDTLEGVSDASDEQKALVRVWKKRFEEESLIPVALVEKLSEASSACQSRWFTARQDGNYKDFYPHLERLVDLVKESASITSRGRSLYDTLLDRCDAGFNSEQIENLFDGMRKTILDVVKQGESSGALLPDEKIAFLYKKYDVEKQKRFSNLVLKDMGFEFDRGSVGVSAHPFTSTLGSDDIRITTRFEDSNVTSQIYTIIHEGGHAIYEMGANNGSIMGTSLGRGESNTFHESQSRLWENLVARSTPFWEHYFPVFCDIFPSQTKGIALETFMKAVNTVRRDDVRVNADEVTYGLHIIMRYRLEKEFIDGKLKIKDLPDAWDEMSLNLLGKRPDSIKSGVLQDVHWMSGLYGYFPSYALGNLINAHIWHFMAKDIDLDNVMKSGNLSKIKDYLTEKYYHFGAVYPSGELLRRVTGKELDASYFDVYLKEKYRRLFK
ncbi:MAG: carboxypeptidase M32 [Sphaerochaeta sp.]